VDCTVRKNASLGFAVRRAAARRTPPLPALP
jgi:hypothetical protein